MNKEEIKEILDKLSNRKQETLLQGLRECQLKNIKHVFITREEYIDKILNYIKYLEDNWNELKSIVSKLKEDRYYANDFERHTAYNKVLIEMQEIEDRK